MAKGIVDEIKDLLNIGPQGTESGEGGTEEGVEDSSSAEPTEGTEGTEEEEEEEDVGATEEGEEEGTDEDEEGEEDEEEEPIEEDEGGEEEEGEDDEEEEDEAEPTTPKERAELFEQIAELKAQVEEEKAKRKGKKEPDEPEEPVFEFEAFIQDDEAYEAAIQSRESFNQLLVEVARKASLAAVKAAVQQVNPIISARVAEQVTNQQLVQDFFRSNPDLVPARRFVATLFTQLQAAHPEKGYVDLLEMTAKEAKEQMGLVSGKKKVGKKVKGRKRSSIPPSGRGSPRRFEKPQAPKGVASEIEEMLGI